LRVLQGVEQEKARRRAAALRDQVAITGRLQCVHDLRDVAAVGLQQYILKIPDRLLGPLAVLDLDSLTVAVELIFVRDDQVARLVHRFK
jgi:hypothetical protein